MPRGMYPTQFSNATVLSACAKLSSSFQGRWFHAEIEKDRYINDIFVGSALIDMIHGYGNEAVCLYKDMIASGFNADGITFVTILTACSHSGLVDAGNEIFNSMQQEHGVEPVLGHYTCMIDCLGRAGRFHEAEIVIDEIPCKDDPVVWEVLLSSCQVHVSKKGSRRTLPFRP
ncbi:Pentatricopeptide repeat [Melia azedarach]|uniref:Pentatricopeptide repeat n=1 Tax=Melia azedarach TaxID=155640 RepID=A0ACC1WVC3_MELAZ|nr:Pentatricopeptide repeat [Melia azedarach]